jgi:hypothetical protein
LKEAVLDRNLWRTRFGKGYALVVRQATELNIFTAQKIHSLVITMANMLMFHREIISDYSESSA